MLGAPRRQLAVAVLAVGLLAGCSAGTPTGPGATTPARATPQSAPAPGGPRVITTGLEVPWGLAFLPDGSALVTERKAARISRVAPDGKVTPVGTVAGVSPQGEGGLMGIAVSPGYATDRAVYVSFTGADDNRVVRLTAAADGTIDGARQQPVVTGIPKGSIHNGGAVAFGPDGFLYVATGEAGRRDPAQDRADLGGKILRVTTDGAPAPGNPFGTAVYSYGHRNVQGLAFDPQGRLWATEFGQNTYDEVNLITPGGNYGWPVVEGIGKRAGYTDPLVQWTTDEASPSGLAIAGGSLYVAALRGARIWEVPLAGAGVGTPQALAQGEFGRIRGAATAPDGRSVWFTTSNRDGRGSPTGDDDRILVLPVG
ncbi:PQQ-dependent sugar dehydrogenase [Pseudonocardia ailaonensis]|uniref:PQQ-dependent sugar dehydrogenase n=1 Tax=Pseudonocardia ailaonensis TaxID=367279 RepID=A0ABN2NCX9_9PSEU